jgi:hypothetical protein
LDPYGDHFKHSKSSLSNACRDTVHTILAAVVPLAGLCSSSHDVSIEPPALLINHPTKRPADVGITLSHTPAISLLAPFAHVAIDITITKAPRLPAPETNLLSKAHHTSARAKFAGTYPNIIADLNSTGIFLLPFTIDHLGGIGHHFHRFLYPPNALLLPPEPLPFTEPNDFLHYPAYVAHTNSETCPAHILKQANHNWYHMHGHATRFGTSYHTTLPQQWATQALALNLSYRLAQHMAIAVVKESDHKMTERLHQISRSFHGKTFFT